MAETETRDLFLARCEVGGGVGAVGDMVPCEDGNDDAGEAFDEEEESPWCDGGSLSEFDDPPCEGTCE